jgi:sarcosine oxidase subunit beta
MLDIFRKRRMWRPASSLKSSYDVVIIGGGSHGLATAHYLRDHGITDVAILEKRYIGSGAAGRNTTILRSNYKTPEGARFYDASVKLYEGLSQDLNFNLLFSQCGHLTLAHSDRAMFVMANRAEVNRLQGIDSRLIGPDEVKELAPAMHVSGPPTPTYPILGALYHPPGGIIRHDAVVWGLARSADAGGAEIHQNTEVLSLKRSGNRITHVETDRGTIAAGQVLNCTAGWSTLLSDMAGVRLPITTHILQACVTEPMKPLLDVVIVSSQMHVYISQTDRGEFLMGAEIEPWTTYRMQGTLNFLQDVSRHALELFPQLERARLLRSWAGLCDLSPDYSPILGQTDVDNFHVSAGWGTYGFKAAPIVGKTLAELVATGRQPDLIEPFKLERFYEDKLVSELAAAAVSH